MSDKPAPSPQVLLQLTETAWWRRNPLLMGLVDAQGRFIKINDAWERELGWTQNELSTVMFLEYVHPDDIERTLRERENVQAGDLSLRFTNRYITQDGRYVPIEWTSIPDGEYIITQGRVLEPASNV